MIEMTTNKTNFFLLMTTILSTFVLLIGATFSYFNIRNMSDLNALAVEAGEVKLGLGVSEIYNHGPLIPLKDEYIDLAYERECKDDYERSCCLAYSLEVFNYKESQEVEGKIDFTIEGIENLSYMLLDEEGNRYLDINHIDKDSPQGLTLGKPFTLDKAIEPSWTSKKFTLLIWLTDNGKNQNKTDSFGNFTATTTFSTSHTGRLTASVKGMESQDQNSSVLS